MMQPPHYTATVEDTSGQRSLLTLQITGGDAQGAFDWSCANRGLKRVGGLQQAREGATMDTPSTPYGNLTRWFQRLWQYFTK